MIAEAMADIAAIFHWPLADLGALAVDELFAWHRRAVARFEAMNGR